MKYLLYSIVFLNSLLIFSQEEIPIIDFTKDDYLIGEKVKILYDKDWKPTIDIDSVLYFREITFKEKNIPSGRIIDYYINGVKQNMFYASYVGLDKQGLDTTSLQGPVTYYYETGKKKNTSTFINNVQVGDQITFYESGEIKRKVDYINNLKQGEEIDYYKTGEVESKINYIDDLAQGELILYYETGEVESKINYIDDLTQGEQIGYYVSGEIKYKQNWVNNLRQGEQIWYYETGEIKFKISYIDDLAQGEQIWYYKTGEVEFKRNYIDDLAQGELIGYYKSGEVELKRNYIDDLAQGEQIGYYKTGEFKFKRSYIDDLKQGEQIGYYKTGEVESKRSYIDDLAQGEQIDYYKTGEVKFKRNYIDDLAQGEKIGYYESGEVELKRNYIDDLAQGEQIGYYESGEIKYKLNWVNNLRQGEQVYYKSGQTKDTISGLYIEDKIDYTKLWENNTIKQRRLALVIGNGNYEKGVLKNPVNDANLIAESLKKLNFEVLLHTNLATEDAMLDVIKDFGRKRKNYEIGFVYYAGHGVQLNNQNYLLPTKEIFEYVEDIEDNAVSIQRVLRYLEASREGQLNFVVLDACRDNPFESNWNKTRSLKGGGLAKTPPPRGSLIAYSTDHGQTAADGEGKNSIYSKALAKNILIENISIEQVFKNVRTEVLNLSNNKQSTVEESKLTGEIFYLNKSDQ